jgi:hypothetical protein
MPIEFDCPECGQRLGVRDGLANLPIKCPSCSVNITVPAQGLSTPEPQELDAGHGPVPEAGAEGVTHEPPREASKEAEAEGPGRVKEGPRGRSAWALLGVGLCCLLGAGFLVWWFFPSGGAGALKPWVPGEGQGFISVRVADLWKTSQVQQIVAEVHKEQGLDDPAEQIEQLVGFRPEEIERATAVFADIERSETWVVIETVGPIDEPKLRAAVVGLKDETHGDRKFFHGTWAGKPATGLHVAGPRILVFGPVVGVKKAIEVANERKGGALDDGLARLSSSRHVVAAFAVPGKLADAARRLSGGPQEARDMLLPLTEIQSGGLTVRLGTDLEFEATVHLSDIAKAEAAKEAAGKLLDVARKQLKKKNEGADGEADLFAEQSEKALDAVKITQSGTDVVVRSRVDMGPEVMGKVPATVALLGQTIRVMKRANNFRQVLLAYHFHREVYNGFPTNITDKAGKPLLSWRVAILPFIEQDPLYKKFKLDEPWDSPHNKKLIPLMPKTYLRAGETGGGRTSLVAISGPGSVHSSKSGGWAGAGVRIDQIKDGLNNTVAIVDSNLSVEWTRPEDLKIDMTGKFTPPRAMFRNEGGRYLFSMFDGSVRRVKATAVSDDTLRAVLTPFAGDKVGPDWERAAR